MTLTKPPVPETTPQEQERFFAEFVTAERASGGPDPHLKLAVECARRADTIAEGMWRLACYVAVYNVPGARAIWDKWPFDAVRGAEPALEPWIAEHWAGIPFRRERRAVRTATKLAAHLISLHRWLAELPGKPWLYTGDYEAAWEDADPIWGQGRYMRYKFLEALHRYAELPIRVGDLRPRGGTSPREALALLYPQYGRELRGNDRPENLEAANMCGAWARETLAERYGIDIDWYELQATLCEYKQSWLGQSQYPGRAQDSELAHWHKAAAYWGWDRRQGKQPDDMLLTMRKRLFPARALGERNGWDGRREELGIVLTAFGYTWSDATYDYWATVENGLANPVRW